MIVHGVKPHRPKQTRCGINHARRGVTITRDPKAIRCDACTNQAPNSTYAGVTHRLAVYQGRTDRTTSMCGERLFDKKLRKRGDQDLTCIACLSYPV